MTWQTKGRRANAPLSSPNQAERSRRQSSNRGVRSESGVDTPRPYPCQQPAKLPPASAIVAKWFDGPRVCRAARLDRRGPCFGQYCVCVFQLGRDIATLLPKVAVGLTAGGHVRPGRADEASESGAPGAWTSAPTRCGETRLMRRNTKDDRMNPTGLAWRLTGDSPSTFRPPLRPSSDRRAVAFVVTSGAPLAMANVDHALHRRSQR